MTHGLDSGFLVAAEVIEHAENAAARETLARLLSAGDLIAIAPQVLAEFIHIITDPRRFTHLVDMEAARQLAEQWWTAREVLRVYPDDGATHQFLAWLQQFDGSPASTISPFLQTQRKFHWPRGRRPDDHAGLTDLGL